MPAHGGFELAVVREPAQDLELPAGMARGDGLEGFDEQVHAFQPEGESHEQDHLLLAQILERLQIHIVEEMLDHGSAYVIAVSLQLRRK